MTQIASLPSGLIIDKSAGPWQEGDLFYGAAITRNADSDQWYASDLCMLPGTTDPTNTALHFGPFPTRQLASYQIDSQRCERMEAEGTDGSSEWLVLP